MKKLASRMLGAIGLEFRRKTDSAENPANNMWDILAGDSSNISREKALTISAVLRAVTLISGGVGKLPLDVFKRISDTGKVAATDHPIYNLLRHEPNSEMAALKFRETIQAHALLNGDGISYILRNDKSGAIEQIIPLNPEYTYPVRLAGVLWYITQNPKTNEQIRLYPYEVLHIHGLGFDGISGYSALRYGAMIMGIAESSNQFSKSFLDNGAWPGIVLEHPAKLSPEAHKNLLNSWNQMRMGAGKAFKTAITEEGIQVKTVSINPEDAQLIEQKKLSIKDIANIFGIPSHKLGDDSKSGYNSIESENQSFLAECLDYWLITWEEECRRKLLTEQEKRLNSHFIEFNRNALVRADIRTRMASYKLAIGNMPWMTANEIRAMENMNPLEDERADELQIPTNNYAPAKPAAFESDTVPENEPPEPPETESKSNKTAQEAAKIALNDAKKRMETRLNVHFSKCKTTEEKRGFWLLVEDQHGKVMRDAIKPIADCFEALSGEKEVLKRTIDAIINKVQKDNEIIL